VKWLSRIEVIEMGKYLEMVNYYGTLEINVHELAKKIQSEEDFVLLDVRETWEMNLAGLRDRRLVVAPMSRLVQGGTETLPEEVWDKNAQIVVICHHGVRSAEVTAWLMRQGWFNVRSLAGGIEAYALSIDPSVGRY
jgi:rhodanese-related sulfurtransferase